MKTNDSETTGSEVKTGCDWFEIIASDIQTTLGETPTC